MKKFLSYLLTKLNEFFTKGASDLETTQTETEPKSLLPKWRWIAIGFLLGLLVSMHNGSCARAGEPARNLEDIHAASCRVFAIDSSGRGAIGTGTICGLIGGKYYVLTNWHVVENHRQVTLHFFGNGRITECNGTVVATWHNESQPYDFAIITIEQNQLAKYDPPFVPLAERGTRPTTGGTILSSGCSEGRWSLAWKGSIESYYGQTAQFFPAPKGGQSGSAIIEKIDGQYYITGILTWRVGDERQLSEEEMRGGAIPISKLYEAFDGKYKTGTPNSVPPNAVWCRIENPGNADASSDSNESVKDEPQDEAVLRVENEPVKDEPQDEAVLRVENEPVKDESQDEAVLRVENESVKDEPQDEAVLRVEPETQSQEKTIIPQDVPEVMIPKRFMTYAIGNTEDFETPVAKKDVVEMIFFTSEYCIPCKQAKPIVAEFVKKGYVIHTISIDAEEGRKDATSRKVTCTPTFIAYRSADGRKTWTETVRFTGVANLSERLLQAFSQGASGGVDSRLEGTETSPDLGSVAPLIDEYGSGWRGFQLWKKPDDENSPDSGEGESGLFRSNENILQRLFQSFLNAVLFRAAILIAIFWFVMYGVLFFLQKLFGLLPKISLQIGRKATTESIEN